MDLRPKIVGEIVDAILADLDKNPLAGRVSWGSALPEERARLRERWVALGVPHFKAHSIPFPRGQWVSCYDKEVVEAFRAKYPALQRLIDLAQAEALRRWPEATFRFEVHSDPEGCHTCHEGQGLVMHIHTDLDFHGPDGELEGSPYDEAHDAWMDWQCDEGPYDDLEREIGEEARLFRTDLQWKRETEDEGEE
jgi:hypothetical protein